MRLVMPSQTCDRLLTQLTWWTESIVVHSRSSASARSIWRTLTSRPPTSISRLAHGTRNADYARELLALHVRVPWSAWDGYGEYSGYETGIVWEYNADARRFTVRFPPHAECEDIGMSWAELRGEVPCLSSATECAKLDEPPANALAVELTTQPRGHRPRDAVWDQRKGAWVDCSGHDYDPSESMCARWAQRVCVDHWTGCPPCPPLC